MKLAFLISAHKDPRQLERLLRALPEHSEFFIHIDKKSDISTFTDIITETNVHFLKHRTDVVWGSINEVEYQMELIRATLEYSDIDYLISMSGMDYPIWSNNDIIGFFAKAAGKEFIQGIDMTHQGDAARLYREFRPLNDKHWNAGSLSSKCRVIMRKTLSAIGIHKSLCIHTFGKDYKLYKGAAWWAITSQLAKLVLKQWDNNTELRHYFKTSFCPAETFIQTVAFNSEFADKCMLTKGKYKDLASLTPLTYINYNPVIKILTEEDFDTIIKSGKMFCRKVISEKSDRLIEMIDTKLTK